MKTVRVFRNPKEVLEYYLYKDIQVYTRAWIAVKKYLLTFTK